MHRLQEVIRLHRMGRSGREVARQLGMGRETTRIYLTAFSKAGLLDGDAEQLPEVEPLRAAVKEHIPSRDAPKRRSTVERWQSKIETLRDKGAGPTAIHDHLRLHSPDYTGHLSSVKRMCWTSTPNIIEGPGPAVLGPADQPRKPA